MLKIIVCKKGDRPDCIYYKETLGEALRIVRGQKGAYCHSARVVDCSSGEELYAKVFTD